MVTRGSSSPDCWLIAADRGGTFTDCCGIAPDGSRHRAKLLSSGRLRLPAVLEAPGVLTLPAAAGPGKYPDGFFTGWSVEVFRAPATGGCAPVRLHCGAVRHSRGAQLILEAPFSGWTPAEETGPAVPGGLPAGPALFAELHTGEPAPVAGARLLTGTRLGQLFPPHEFRLATTLATNALLENQGSPVAFFVTAGFGSLLEIGDQRRADLFALDHRREAPLHAHTVEVTERLDAAGGIVTALDGPALAAAARDLASRGVRSAAVAFAHSDVNPVHEQAAGRILREAGFTTISLSSSLASQIRLLPRAWTAVLDAALAPVMRTFVEKVREGLGTACRRFYCLTSAGGLAPPEEFHARDSLLSGPAGGVTGCAEMARRCGFPAILTLDMGGTSTDVARWEGEFAYQFEQRHGRLAVLAPSLRIETVAAGGGSIVSVAAGALTVGPRSAGADPGPACYGRGGPLTLTDVNLLLGRLDPDKAGIPLLRAPAVAALEALKRTMREHNLPLPEEDTVLLHGLLRIAVGRMAEAVRAISVRDGCDPSSYTLLAFGGAGPQHACAIAEELGITRVLIPAEAGLLSAAGAVAALPEKFGQRQLLRPLEDGGWAAGLLEELCTETLAGLNHPQGRIRRRLADLRLQGQETALTLSFGHPMELPEAFRTAFRKLYGYAPPDGRPIELVALRVAASPAAPEPQAVRFPDLPAAGHPADGAGGPGLDPFPDSVRPVIIQDAFSTLVLEPGWTAVTEESGNWLLTRTSAGREADASLTPQVQAEAATAELFRCRFQGLADSMGELLRRTAVSTNVRERLDYSCALLDADGRLLVNAPHIPVHLGALGECVRRSVAVRPPGPGDVLVTNDPAFGGSHLPDVTVILPVFAPSGKLLAYTANRAHHAEIGGISPGSMPAAARNLAEEGVVIPPAFLVRGGVSCEEGIARLLTTAPWPTRTLADNLADLRAQAAAAHHGAAALRQLCREHGEETVRFRLAGLTAQAAAALPRTLAASPLTTAEAAEALDDGTPIQVRLTKKGGRLAIDFTGSGGVHPGNRNATPAVVRSAVLYVIRLWTGEPIPLNEGFLEGVDLTLPPGFLNPPFADDPSSSPAVVGGNVETSQRVVDVLIRALGLQAGSQGTMNNMIFGNDSFGHYETVCGGSGAGPGYPGTDGVHTHMTNTAITDVEILERRYPVRVECFAIRPGSGGRGRQPGGCGVVRLYHFLAPLTLSLLTEHRLTPPQGLEGGLPGGGGRQFLELPDGTRQDLPPTVTLTVSAGTRLHLHTPGGGGWGAPDTP